MRLLGLGAVLFSLFFGIIHYSNRPNRHSHSRELVRIQSGNPRADSLLTALQLHPVKQDEQGRWRDYALSFKQMLFLQDQGVDLALIVQLEDDFSIPPEYLTYENIISRLRTRIEKNPRTTLVQIGTSAMNQQPIYALQIADPDDAHHKPEVLLTAGYHGLEGVGVQVCLGLIEAIATISDTNFFVGEWLNKVNFWFVPVVNPDGYDLVVSGQIQFPWWRKNLSDNNQDNQFNAEFDGVDLNRNFDYQWVLGGSAEPTNWQYRGPAPFSEPETQAIRYLVESRRFIAGLTFHSHGELVLYPQTRNALVMELAQKIAAVFEKEGGGSYEIMPLNRFSGQSSNWLFFQHHILEYTLELSNQDFPEDKVVRQLTQQSILAVRVLIEAIERIEKGDKFTDTGTDKLAYKNYARYF